jgi:hypothetical protein
MPDLMARAAAFVADKLGAHASRRVTYVRGQEAAELDATVGRSSFDLDDGHGIVRFHVRDYVVRRADLVLSGIPAVPRRGDVVEERMPDGTCERHEVVNLAGAPEWRPCDSSGVLIRIHTKRLEAT